MNGLSSQLREIQAIASAVAATRPVAEILIFTPATLIEGAVQIAAGRIGIGGQDCDATISGAFTGDISAQMLKDAGACSVIVGHSERRQHHGETDAMVAAKANAAWRAGLQVILCIGETQSQRRDGRAFIRHCLELRLGAEGTEVRIFYGGSVKPSNAHELLALPEVGGALIGGASLKAAEFEAIIRAFSNT